jgi:hypothetical protein
VCSFTGTEMRREWRGLRALAWGLIGGLLFTYRRSQQKAVDAYSDAVECCDSISMNSRLEPDPEE